MSKRIGFVSKPLIIKIKRLNIKQLFIVLIIDLYVLVALFFQQHLYNGILKSEVPLFIIGLSIFILAITDDIRRNIFFKIYSERKIVIVLLIFILLDSLIIRSRIMFGAIFDLFVGVAIAKQLNSLKRYYSLTLIPFWFLVVYIVMRLHQNFNPEMVFINSRNYISFYLIITVIPYYFLKFKNHDKTSISPALITFLLSAASLGRSGILSSFFILLIVSFVKMPQKIYKYKWVIFGVVAGVVIYIFIFYLKDLVTLTSFKKRTIIETLNKYNNLNDFLTSKGRSTIIRDYLKSLNVFMLLLGANIAHPPPNTPLSYVMARYGHLHSSLLNMFAAIGFGALIFFGFILNKIRSYYSENKVIMFLFLALLMRISTDVGLLFSYFDFVIWIFLISSEYSKI